MAKISPLAPQAFPSMPVIEGVRLGAAHCGIRYKGRTDLFVAELAPNTTAAGVFTRSKTASAPVRWCQKALQGGQARVIVVNSGNSNAFTGQVGEESVRRTVDAASALWACPPEAVMIASTGVIGERLPEQRIIDALPDLKAALEPASWEAAARGIMTTDTFPKGAARTAKIGGETVRINGIAKGSGMIAPDMATMLAFVFTDATLPASVLQALLAAETERSFNAITVDSDTSTSDSLILCATGAVRHAEITSATDRKLAGFRQALREVLVDLAHQIVRDGEGATKFVTVNVTGAAGAKAAKRIGMAIANSPLVKTAVAGEDANWGRIVMAVGKSGEKAERDRLRIKIGGFTVAENGAAVPGYDETPVAAHMKGQEILIEVDVGVGKGSATVWTCDLTHGYIDINGSYRS